MLAGHLPGLAGAVHCESPLHLVVKNLPPGWQMDREERCRVRSRHLLLLPFTRAALTEPTEGGKEKMLLAAVYSKMFKALKLATSSHAPCHRAQLRECSCLLCPGTLQSWGCVREWKWRSAALSGQVRISLHTPRSTRPCWME